ncbi:MAG TPA: hypothetical protein PKX92_05330 [Edaphocola sp.]|nr:hypothetical protein [Edaphocola sp.]
MKKLILMGLVLSLSFSGVYAGWTLWQPTTFSNNGDGNYTLICENYAYVACASSSGSSTQPTVGDAIRVTGPDGIIGDFVIVDIQSEGNIDENSNNNPPVDTGSPWVMEVNKK